MSNRHDHIPPVVVNSIIVVVMVAWAVNLIVGYFDPERANAYVNVAFGLIIGGVFAIRRESRGLPESNRDDDLPADDAERR